MTKSTKELVEGQRIGPYQIVAKLGGGYAGDAYLTTMHGPAGFSKLAFVKELQPEWIKSARRLEGLLNDVRLAARLTHPNIIHTYGANEDHGRLYVAMEYLDGQPLSRVRRALGQDTTYPLTLHIHVLAEALAGLHCAHELRDYDGAALTVVHGGLHPHNIFVTYDGHVKVADFGVARADGSDEMPVDVLAYLAPEQARGESFDRRADVFTMGVMLWEAITGKPFAEHDDPRALREQRAQRQVPRLRERMPDIPGELADICDRALALAPDDRFRTAGEFRKELLAYVGGEMQDSDRVQLGECLLNSFRQERARIHELIEKRLQDTATTVEVTDSPVSGTPAAPARNDASPTIEVVLRSERGDADIASAADPSPDASEHAGAAGAASALRARRVPRARIVATLGAATLVLCTVWLWERSADPKAKPSVARITAKPLQPRGATPAPFTPTHAEAPSAAAEPANATMELRVSATPSEVHLSVDGVALSGNPAVERRAIDNQLHVVRAVGPDLRSQERIIAFDGDHSVTFNLTHNAQALDRRVLRERRPARETAPMNPPVVSHSVTAPALPPREAPALEPDYDAPLSRRERPRPIFEEDPYP